MGFHLTVDQRRRVRQLRTEGMTVADVAREIGCSLRTVKRVVATQGKREERQTRWSPSERRLSPRSGRRSASACDGVTRSR